MGILIILVVLGIGLIALAIHIDKNDWSDGGFVPCVIVGVISLCVAAILVVLCISVQACAEPEIYRLEQKREALVESYNIYSSNYDGDLAHSQALKDARLGISEFNAEINTNNYFCQNFFLNWFYIDCRGIEPIQIVDGLAQ